MSDINLTQLLINGQNPDPQIRNPAEAKLKNLESQNLALYVVELSKELSTQNKPSESRHLAGLLLKNAISSHDEKKNKILQQRWMMLPQEARVQVREMSLNTLSAPLKPIRSTSAMVVAKIASIEIPAKSWPGAIDILVERISKSTSDSLRQACFETLGFICEEIPSNLQDKSNTILTAISSGMKAQQPIPVKLSATRALANSLEFAKGNFANLQERNLILQMVFSSAHCTGSGGDEVQVRVAAYQCLVEIASTYYQYIGEYMMDIFKLTASAISNESEEVAQQAIEFWSTIADNECEILQDAEEFKEKGLEPPTRSQNFCQLALKDLMPLLLTCLTKQSPELNNDDWDVAKAAGACLLLVAQCVQDAIFPHALPFVEKHIQSNDWRYKEASILVFGSILDGPDRDALVPIVKQVFGLILGQMQDSHLLVKETAAWTVGRICETVPDTIGEEILPRLMEALLNGLREPPTIAANVCWAIYSLSDSVEVPQGQQSSPLSPYFEGFMNALFATTERPDASKGNLMTSAYEAINIMIQNSAPDVWNIIRLMVPVLIDRLRTSLMKEGLDGEELQLQIQVQGHLCGSLMMVVLKMDNSVVMPHADNLMTLFLRVLQTESSTLHEESFVAIGAMVVRTGQDFLKYMQALGPFLLKGLKSSDSAVCTNAVGVVISLAQALEKELAPFCDEIMKILLQNLANKGLEPQIHGVIISCLGDIALAVSGYFERYLPYVMTILIQHSEKQFDSSDMNDIQQVQANREAILEAYTGIVQGLAMDNHVNRLFQYVDKVVMFINMIAQDVHRTSACTKHALGLVGDLAKYVGPPIAPKLRTPFVENLLTSVMHGNETDPDLKDALITQAKYAQEQLQAPVKS